MTLIYCSYKLSSGAYVHQPIKYFDAFQVFGHIGIAMFAFEGNCVILNIRAEARNKRAYPSLLVASIASVLALYMAFATVGYLTYRGLTKDFITFNF